MTSAPSDTVNELHHLRDSITMTRGPEWCVHDGLITHTCGISTPASGAAASAYGCSQRNPEDLATPTPDFIVDHDRAVVRDFVCACVTCQKNKTESLNAAGLLQQLPVPSHVWADISMDFIEGLPKVHVKSVILNVVDCFSKYMHFIALDHPYTAASVARAFFSDIVRLHGFLASIVSDRDPIFNGHVWCDLFKLAGVELHIAWPCTLKPTGSQKR